MSPAKIPDSKVKQIIGDYALGMKNQAVALKYGVSTTFVSKTAIRHGLRRQYYKLQDYKSNRFSSEQVNEILMDYKSGMLLKLIAFKYGVSESYVRKLALRNGMRLRQPRKTDGVDDGGTVREIGI